MRKLLRKFYNVLFKHFGGKGIGKFVRPIHRFIKRFSNPRTAIVEGFKMYLDPKDESVSRMLEKGTGEPTTTKYFKVEYNDIVLDIGAHIGYYSLLASRNAEQVYAFEPSPRNFKYLKKNTKNYSNIKIFNVAVSDTNENLKLYLHPGNTGDNRIYPVENSKCVKVKSIILDNEIYDKVREYDKEPNFIKIDVEGAEMRVFKGATRLLKNPKLRILTEFWPYAIKGCGNEPREYLELLQSNGFSLFDVVLEKYMTIEELLEKYKETNLIGRTDLFCEK